MIFELSVPLVLAAVGLCAVLNKTDAFPALTRGAAKGLRTLCDMLPPLCVLFPAVYMLRASGALDALGSALSPALAYIGIPPETVPLALLRPVSGAASTAAAADSLAGRCAAVMIGSSETTLYVVAVYFGAARIKNTRWAIPAALLADAAVFLSSAWVSRLMWG